MLLEVILNRLPTSIFAVLVSSPIPDNGITAIRILEYYGRILCLKPWSSESLPPFLPSMAPEAEQLSSLSNPLATLEQLSHSSSQLDGIPADLESSIRFAGARLTQAAGILLRLPQEIAAQAVIIYTRFYMGSEGGSFRINAARVCGTAAFS
jgi:hypothetical protein